MLTVKGTIKVQDNDFRVNLPFDFIRYYSWLIRKYYWIHVSEPLHGAHITVLSSKIHNIDTTSLKEYHNTTIDIPYVPDLVVGARRKAYRNFYIRVYSEFLEEIKRRMGVEDRSILHVTIANTKNVPKDQWFPPLISLT